MRTLPRPSEHWRYLVDPGRDLLILLGRSGLWVEVGLDLWVAMPHASRVKICAKLAELEAAGITGYQSVPSAEDDTEPDGEE